jgi:hypothetical protein
MWWTLSTARPWGFELIQTMIRSKPETARPPHASPRPSPVRRPRPRPPADAAFKALEDTDNAALQTLLKNPAKVAEILKYHVVPGAALSGQRIVGLVEKGGGKWQFATLVPKELVNVTLVDGAAAVNGEALQALRTGG